MPELGIDTTEITSWTAVLLGMSRLGYPEECLEVRALAMIPRITGEACGTEARNESWCGSKCLTCGICRSKRKNVLFRRTSDLSGRVDKRCFMQCFIKKEKAYVKYHVPRVVILSVLDASPRVSVHVGASTASHRRKKAIT